MGKKPHYERVSAFEKIISDLPKDYIKTKVNNRIQKLAFPFRNPRKYATAKLPPDKITQLAKGLAANVKDPLIIDQYAQAACHLSLNTWKNIMEKSRQFIDAPGGQKILNIRIIAPLRGSYTPSLLIEDVFKRLASKYSKNNLSITIDVCHPIMSKSLGTSDLDLKKTIETMKPDRFIPHQEPYPLSKTVDVYVDEVISGATIRSTLSGLDNIHLIGFASKNFQQYIQSPLSQLIPKEGVYEERLPSKNIIANYYLLDLITNDNPKLSKWDFGKRPEGNKMPNLTAKKGIAATSISFNNQSDIFPIYDYESTYGGELADAFVFAVHKKIQTIFPKLFKNFQTQNI